ncbi:hypothetical protein INT43_005641 [Umbelopsis isabellina]|uniref:Uncharacterized protein n=1 Tax=Mortierella isabellina TaxID=91625 RepID=A0A8H7UCE6_MORIS|nr:hypothetical protein INT43_005641 [Umbelopsis isabellina]
MPRSRHVLAMLLVIAIITTGFFLSYDDVHRPQIVVNHDQTKFMVPLSGQQPISAQQPKEETYLTYLPHSGFHSQLVAFENAIMMAYYTNRTLLAPMLRLGTSFDFAPFDELRHSYLTQNISNQDAILIPWSSLFDLRPLLNNYNVRILEKTEKPSDGISDTNLGVNPSDDMIYFVNSSQELRSWKFYDKENNASPLGAYKEKWTLQQVKNIDKPLLYFGSMFGRGRVMATVPEHQAFQRFLRQQFKITHPGLKETADRIIEVLGGPSQYVGLQLLSPASGKVKQQHVIEESIQSLLTELDLDEMQMGDNDVAGRDCLDDQQSPKLYLATDLTLPASNPVLTRLRRLFPCTIAYQDLVTWNLLNDKLQDVKDEQGNNVGHFYIPLVDGIVASRAAKFFGQQGSGFGQFFQQAWQLEH